MAIVFSSPLKQRHIYIYSFQLIICVNAFFTHIFWFYIEHCQVNIYNFILQDCLLQQVIENPGRVTNTAMGFI